jgi:hypothetical protein
MAKLIAALATLSVAACAQSSSVCQPLPGADALWSKPGVRFILLGEMHGTTEAPALFRDLVCAAAAGKRPVVVGVERSSREQAAIDTFMRADGHAAAVDALLAERGWGGFDGRSSRAMLTLLEALRILKLEGKVSEVLALDGSRPDDPDAVREQCMASALIAAAGRHPNALVLALTGNVHASKRLIEGFGSYPFMAMLLPATQTISLFVADKGGEAWTQEGGCGPHKLRSTGGDRRGITLSETTSPLPGFDGTASTGLAATASTPAIPNAPPPPACSVVRVR